MARAYTILTWAKSPARIKVYAAYANEELAIEHSRREPTIFKAGGFDIVTDEGGLVTLTPTETKNLYANLSKIKTDEIGDKTIEAMRTDIFALLEALPETLSELPESKSVPEPESEVQVPEASEVVGSVDTTPVPDAAPTKKKRALVKKKVPVVAKKKTAVVKKAAKKKPAKKSAPAKAAVKTKPRGVVVSKKTGTKFTKYARMPDDGLGREGSKGRFIAELLVDGKTDEFTFAALKKKFPKKKTTLREVAWKRWDLIKRKLLKK